MTKFASVALMLVASVLATNATAEPTVSSTNSGIPGIEIANSGSIPENTAAELRSDSAGDFLPYAVVVRNTGSLSVTGLVVRYEISVNGKAVWWAFHYLSTAQLYITFPDLASPDSSPIIAPGGSIIIVPFHNLNNARMVTETKGGNKIDFLNSPDRVTIEVDSVIRSDGTIVGPDRSLQFHQFQSEISGYTEFRNHLLQLFAEGATVADIHAWLQQTADQMVVRRPDEPVDRGIGQVKGDAAKYLFLIQNHGLQYAWDQLKQQPPEKVFSQFYKVHQAANQ
jgi:hypothetical protein